MSTVKIKDKTFQTSIAEAEIKSRVKALAQQISHDMEGKTPLFLGVLNGAFIFAADLIREMSIPCEISFVKLASYQGTTSTGKVHEVLGINEDLIKGFLAIHIIIYKTLILNISRIKLAF